MLIVLLGAARGVRNYFDEFNSSQTENIIEVYDGYTTLPYKGYQKERYVGPRTTDIDRIKAAMPDASNVWASANNDTARIVYGGQSIRGRLDLVYPQSLIGSGNKMVAGRYINDRDIDECRRVLVINRANAERLFGTADGAVGRVVKIMGLAWTVVGVYEHRWYDRTFAPYTTYKAITGFDDKAYSIKVQVEGMRTEADGEDAEKRVRTVMAESHSYDPADTGGVWTWNNFTQYLSGVAANDYLNLAVWVIGMLTLLTGIVGVSNIMFVSVRERVHEIGIRRAIGARPRSILAQVLLESVSITTLFGYIGIVMGMVVLQIIDVLFGNSQGFRHPSVDLAIAFEVTLAMIAAGAAAGLFPALKAIKVKPVEALRDE